MERNNFKREVTCLWAFRDTIKKVARMSTTNGHTTEDKILGSQIVQLVDNCGVADKLDDLAVVLVATSMKDSEGYQHMPGKRIVTVGCK